MESFCIEHFQSIESAQVQLGPLTVLVGQSSTGKSAFLRAIRTLVRNTNSPSALLTSGTVKLSLQAILDEHSAVGLQRGKSLSTYTVDSAAGQDTFPKSGVGVPDDVATALRMPLVEGQDLHFAFQFDRPFLLAETASTAAKVLGDLTNVTLLSKAAAQANRRRLEATNTLALRRMDLEQLTAAFEPYATLPSRSKVLTDLHADLLNLRSTMDGFRALTDFVSDLTALESAIAAASLSLQGPEVPVAALESLGASIEASTRLYGLLRALADVLHKGQEAQQALSEAIRRQEEAQRSYHDLLTAAGTCPTCGQEVPATLEA